MESKETVEIVYDEATGLPALPDNLRWKIEKMSTGGLNICIEKKYREYRYVNVWWKFFKEEKQYYDEWTLLDSGDYNYAQTWIYFNKLEGDLKDAVRKATEGVYLRYEQAIQKVGLSDALSVQADELVGAYPPKVLPK